MKNDDIEYNIDDKDSTGKRERELNASNVSDISNVNEWNTCENWHGLVNPINDMNKLDDIIKCSQELPKSKPKKRYKPSYLDKCPEWDFLNNIKSFNLPLIINGSKCKPLHIKQGQSLILQETCAFDSLLQIIASGIAANIEYRSAIESSSDKIFQLARSILETGKILTTHYIERASILQDLPLFQNAITIFTRTIR